MTTAEDLSDIPFHTPSTKALIRGRKRKTGNPSTMTIPGDLADRLDAVAKERSATLGITLTRVQVIELALTALQGSK